MKLKKQSIECLDKEIPTKDVIKQEYQLVITEKLKTTLNP